MAVSAGPISSAARRPGIVVAFLIVTALLLATDLFVKSVAFERVAGIPIPRDADSGRLGPIPPHHPITAIPGVLSLQLTLNEGAVFGLGQGGRWIFVAFTLVATIVIITVFCRSDARQHLLHIALAAVLAGAIGNLVDRMAFGQVRDMLLLFPNVDLPFGWSWPGGGRGLYPWIFNIADVCLVVGLFALVILMHRAAPADDATAS